MSRPSEHPAQSVSRSDLIEHVTTAARYLRDPGDRNAVLHFATKTSRVAVGDWVREDCRCPISAVGIDRMQEDAQMFAECFDRMMCRGTQPLVGFSVEVLDA